MGLDKLPDAGERAELTKSSAITILTGTWTGRDAIYRGARPALICCPCYISDIVYGYTVFTVI